MTHIALQLGGVVGAATGLIHGYLGETKIFRTARIDPPYARRMARLGWQCGAAAWVAMGLLLIAAAGFEDAPRRAVILAAIATYLAGVAGNAIGTRGRHFGWVVLTGAIGLVLTGW